MISGTGVLITPGNNDDVSLFPLGLSSGTTPNKVVFYVVVCTVPYTIKVESTLGVTIKVQLGPYMYIIWRDNNFLTETSSNFPEKDCNSFQKILLSHSNNLLILTNSKGTISVDIGSFQLAAIKISGGNARWKLGTDML